MNHAALVLASTASRLRAEAMQRLAEIPDHGCEAASARAFEEGRLSILDALGFPLLPGWLAGDGDEVIEKRRRELDEALRPEATRQQMAFEPIVRTATIMTMTEPESIEATEAEDAAVEEPADEEAAADADD